MVTPWLFFQSHNTLFFGESTPLLFCGVFIPLLSILGILPPETLLVAVQPGVTVCPLTVCCVAAVSFSEVSLTPSALTVGRLHLDGTVHLEGQRKHSWIQEVSLSILIGEKWQQQRWSVQFICNQHIQNWKSFVVFGSWWSYSPH